MTPTPVVPITTVIESMGILADTSVKGFGLTIVGVLVAVSILGGAVWVMWVKLVRPRLEKLWAFHGKLAEEVSDDATNPRQAPDNTKP